MSKAKPVATDKRKSPGPRNEAARAKPPETNARPDRKDREKLTVYIDTDVLTMLRVHCARGRLELSDVTTEALRKLLVGQSKETARRARSKTSERLNV